MMAHLYDCADGTAEVSSPHAAKQIRPTKHPRTRHRVRFPRGSALSARLHKHPYDFIQSSSSCLNIAPAMGVCPI